MSNPDVPEQIHNCLSCMYAPAIASRRPIWLLLTDSLVCRNHWTKMQEWHQTGKDTGKPKPKAHGKHAPNCPGLPGVVARPRWCP